ncbi:integration host factor subunit alpha [Thiomicrospira sp. R3]|uniref:integration host factor subunit alpha n=1 Tax=Thiomicrospira sp. R3 TaxID=3035472 RepID=UPI00259AEF2B|nr:integration host factor subunit alpha [Thiomicrospira sp. R3]WFE68041.1 integration host factor subunit alpha [Thiomicrospira sp. R3]
MATLTKAEISEKLADVYGFNKREAKELVEDFFQEIIDVLVGGECVKISGFGNFELRDKNSRPGRNPRTGEEVPIMARRVVTFKPGQKLRIKIDSNE